MNNPIITEMFTRSFYISILRSERHILPHPTSPGQWRVRFNPHLPPRHSMNHIIRSIGPWATITVIESPDGLKVKDNESFNIHDPSVDWLPMS